MLASTTVAAAAAAAAATSTVGVASRSASRSCLIGTASLRAYSFCVAPRSAALPPRYFMRLGRTRATSQAALRSSRRYHMHPGVASAFTTVPSTPFSSVPTPDVDSDAETDDLVGSQGDINHKQSLKEQYHMTTEETEKRKLEVEDANLVFEYAWRNLVNKYGPEQMVFPKEIIWLAGAPGAGKGTMAKTIIEQRDLPGAIETSSLFEGERAEQLKAEGKLIGDREVVEAVLEALLDKKFSAGHGALVDGFPRTMVQAQTIKLFFDKLRLLRLEYKDHPDLKDLFRRPIFRIAVLYVEEEESVRRQLSRGEAVLRQNKIFMETGVGSLKPLRATDSNPEAARKRYEVFKSQVYDALQAIKGHFHFHFIPAEGPPEEVKERIQEEFKYQSSLELGDDTFEKVRVIPPASIIVRHARQHMVQRLNAYSRDYPELFNEVLALLQQDFLHIIGRQALAGEAIIRSSSPLLNDRVAVNMVLDILSERGYFVTLEVQKTPVPHLVEASVPGQTTGQMIRCRTDKSFVFIIKFPKPKIRRGN